MRCKSWLSASLAGLVLAFAADVGAAPSPKKGVGMWHYSGETKALTDVGASWFYDWGTGPSGIVPPAGVTFVPMIWGSGQVTTSNLNAVKGQGSVLLGFNEPDNGGQSNMSPQQAINLWPQLVATGMRLGSPAVAANAQAAGGWLDNFMSGAAQKGLRVDFICLHWYGGDFDPTRAVSELQKYVSDTHAKYNLPIWVTEYALTNYGVNPARYPTEAQQAAFASGSVAMLESIPYVERYAWFELPPCTNNCAAGDNKALSFAGGSLTTVGVAYATVPDGGSTMAVDAGVTADAGASMDAGQGPAFTDGASPPQANDAASGGPNGGMGSSTATGATDGGDVAASPEGGFATDADVAGAAPAPGGCQCQLSSRRGRSNGALLALFASLCFLRRRRS